MRRTHHAANEEADRLRPVEAQLSSGTPSVIYLAAGEPSHRLATLEAFASVPFAVPVKVIALQSLPAWRRERAWSTSTPILPNEEHLTRQRVAVVRGEA